jgi:curved DNA-binding protein CbpA
MATRKKDKRRFKRYSKKSNFKIKVGDKSYKAETMDYSVDGIGAEVEDSPPVNIGDVLGINISRPKLSIDGKVVWSRKMKSTTKLGIKRMGVLSGSLKDFSFADIILGLQRSQKTGVLLMVKSPERKSIYIEGGDMIFASSSVPSDRLSTLLLKEGKITPQQFKTSEEVSKKTGKRKGAILVEAGYLGASDLVWAVRKQVENIIESLFAIKDGEFLFKEGPFSTKEFIKLSISAGNIIYGGIKKIEDIEHIKSVCPPADATLGFSPDPLNLFQDLELEEADKEMLKLIEGKKTVKEIVSSYSAGKLAAVKAIHALLSVRMIEVLEAQDEGADITAESIVGEKPKEDYEEVAAKILKLYEEHERLGYYGVLGIKETANSTMIKRAYYSKAREFHPDKHYHLPGDMKDKLNKLFTYITTAYSTLISPNLRNEYDNMPKTASGEAHATNVQVAAQRFKEGMDNLDSRNYSEAAKLFGAAAYLDDLDSRYHYFSGIALSKDRKYKEAERAFNRALRAEPFKASYLAEAGHVYLALGLPLRAKGNFEKALKLEANNKRAKEGMEKFPSDG